MKVTILIHLKAEADHGLGRSLNVMDTEGESQETREDSLGAEVRSPSH